MSVAITLLWTTLIPQLIFLNPVIMKLRGKCPKLDVIKYLGLAPVYDFKIGFTLLNEFQQITK